MTAPSAGVPQPCKFGDPTCPCQDGDLCHYVADEDTPAMEPPRLGVPQDEALEAFTPTTQQVLVAYVVSRYETEGVRNPQLYAEFNRWLADLLDTARAEALREAAEELHRQWVEDGHHYGQPGCYSSGYERWLRARADRLDPPAGQEGP